MGNLIGSVISSPQAVENSKFIRQSKNEAKKYEWIYHCTSFEALMSMIKNKEMWLSNLQIVNDKEEIGRIDLPDYEKSYYVGCFTYDCNITDEHWREYGKSEEKVLFGVRQEWFCKKLNFLNTDHTKTDWDCFQIYNSFDDTIEYQMKESRRGNCVLPPYFVMDFGFYKIIYDDKLKKNISNNSMWSIDGVELPGRAITPEIVGIIKSTHGICVRENQESYIKDWTQEKEVRLKVGVQTNNKTIKDSGLYFRQMSVQMCDDAFGELPIRFSPDMTRKSREDKLSQIKSVLPASKIYEI